MTKPESDLRSGSQAALTASTQAPTLDELGPGVDNADEVPLSVLMDLTLAVSIELGRTRMTVQDVLRLGRGSVVQLERLVGEPIDLYVADRRFAEGEVVVLGEHFGVRITRIVASTVVPENVS
jgi:flagellar motor switch protein FliN/FliY